MDPNYVWTRGTVSDVLKRIQRKYGDIYELAANVSLRDASRLMKMKKINSVIGRMSNGGYGIVTTTDIAYAVADGMDLDETMLEEVMTKEDLRTVTPQALIMDALHEMNRGGNVVRHLLVIKDGELVGVLSMKDFVLDLEKFEGLWTHQNQ